MNAVYSPRPSGADRLSRREGSRRSGSARDVHCVYLGGNITRDDWRRSLVSGLGPVGVVPSAPSHSAALWPTLKAAVTGRFDYAGPYSISGDAGDDSEWNGVGGERGGEWIVSGPLYAPQRGPRAGLDSLDPSASYPTGQTQPALSPVTSAQEVWWPVVSACRQAQRLTLAAIRQADLYFAWLDTPFCTATLTELGFAAACGKIIWIAGPQAFDEFWLAYTMADQYSFRFKSPAAAFQNMLELALESRGF